MKIFNHVIFHDAIWISVVAAGPNFSRTSSSYFNHETTPCIFSSELCIPLPSSVQSLNLPTGQVHSVQYAGRASREKEKEEVQNHVFKTEVYAYTEEKELQSYRQPSFGLFQPLVQYPFIGFSTQTQEAEGERDMMITSKVCTGVTI